jgi:glycosyltransferase involved in cell wall biosynthesis
MTAGVLYISYEGMLEPLGQSQVLAYIERLAAQRPIHLISFEKKRDWTNLQERELILHRIAQAGIYWHPLRYHKRPSALATAYDIVSGVLLGHSLIRRHKLRIVHARSYVPGMMALTLKRLTGVKFLFDMRGFWADERVEGGLWPANGLLYKVAKHSEQRFFLGADKVVSLTHAAVREIESFSYLKNHKPSFCVIPTCADLETFQPKRNQGQTRLPDQFVLGYVGSVGTRYLFDEVLACFKTLRKLRPSARLLILNRENHNMILKTLEHHGLSQDYVELKSVSHLDMPIEIARMNAGIFFIKDSYSLLTCAPTKLGELLGCGVPSLFNNNIGDTSHIAQKEKVGVVLSLPFTDENRRDGIQHLLAICSKPGIRERCVQVAHKYFSLAAGVARYAQVYEQLADST